LKPYFLLQDIDQANVGKIVQKIDYIS